MALTLEDKEALRREILARVNTDDLNHPDGNAVCWNWARGLGSGGYGCLVVDGKQQLAHRISYTIFKGEIPDGKQIDHLCRNPHCVNPKHLEAVTGLENIRRGISVVDFKCRKGHEWTKENTGYQPCKTAKDGLARYCKTCRRMSNKQFALLKKYGA